MSSILDLFPGVVFTCTLCDRVKGDPACQCWEKCSCGWSAMRGEFCDNPKTKRCSLKLKNGRYDRSRREWVPR